MKRKMIPVLDISGLASFQYLNGNTPELVNNSGRVVCLFEGNDLFYMLSERFNANEPVPVIDFVNAQKQLKAMCFSLKDRG